MNTTYGIFLGWKLPPGVSHQAFPTEVIFYKDTLDGYKNIGSIQYPYKQQPLSWWKIKLNEILDEL